MQRERVQLHPRVPPPHLGRAVVATRHDERLGDVDALDALVVNVVLLLPLGGVLQVPELKRPVVQPAVQLVAFELEAQDKAVAVKPSQLGFAESPDLSQVVDSAADFPIDEIVVVDLAGVDV